MKSYAFLDEYRVLHVTEDMELAKASTTGKFAETELECKGGYPLVKAVKDDKEIYTKIFVYSEQEAYIFGNKGSEDKVKVQLSDYPEIKKAYEQAM